jgi:anti-anti-sigma factor
MFRVTVCADATGARVVLRGELDTASAPALQQVLDQLRQEGSPKIVLDLAALKFLGTAGLVVLLRTDTQLRAAGGRLILHRPPRLARRVLAITGLDTMLTIRLALAPNPARANISQITRGARTPRRQLRCTSVPASPRRHRTTPTAGKPE